MSWQLNSDMCSQVWFFWWLSHFSRCDMSWIYLSSGRSLRCWWLTVGSSHQHCHFQTSQPCTKIWGTVWNQLGKQSSKSVYLTQKNSALSFFTLLQRTCSGPGFNTHYPLFLNHNINTWSLSAPFLGSLSVPRPRKIKSDKQRILWEGDPAVSLAEFEFGCCGEVGGWNSVIGNFLFVFLVKGWCCACWKDDGSFGAFVKTCCCIFVFFSLLEWGGLGCQVFLNGYLLCEGIQVASISWLVSRSQTVCSSFL